jgi:hypothetical protein
MRIDRPRALLCIAVAALVVGAAAPLAAQAAPSRVSLALGAGAAAGPFSGPALHASLALTSGSRVLSVRHTSLLEFALFVEPAESVWDAGLLYGSRGGQEKGYWSASGGLALVGGTRRGQYLGPSCSGCWLSARYRAERFLTLGIPAEVEAVWTPHRSFGVGAVGFANVSPARSFAGGALQVKIGGQGWPWE